MKNTNDTRIDYGIILSLLILFLISIASIYSTTALIGDSGLMPTIMQVVWYGVGTLGIIILMQFDFDRLWAITPYFYWFGIFLLVLVLFLYDRQLAIDTGARSWFSVGSFSFQPSEPVKLAYILQVAKLTVEHNQEHPDHHFESDRALLLKIFAYSFLPIILVLAQNDFGTALVYGVIMVGMIVMSGIKWRYLLPLVLGISLVAILLIVLVVYNRDFLLNLGFKPYQFSRIDSWLDPLHDTSDASYQLIQAIQAIGSGQIFGKGLGVSEVYVPVRESDMIFTTIAENGGFILSAFLVFVYFILIYQMITVVYDTRNEFYAYTTVGVITMIVFHVFENIGMNIGLLPLTGIPLPFISQGGSALLTNLLGVGLVLSMRYNYDGEVASYSWEDHSDKETKEDISQTNEQELKDQTDRADLADIDS